MASIERLKNKKGITFRVKVRVKGFPSQSATFSSIVDAKQWGKRTEVDLMEDSKLINQMMETHASLKYEEVYNGLRSITTELNK